MGLTNQSTGKAVVSETALIKNQNPNDIIIAIAGNPNVGKSTVFNSLTGLRQHTGNWPGKTVANAQGKFFYNNKTFRLVDIPGTYSLMANSVEEEIARDFICFGEADAIITVVDASCLQRSLNLTLQILEVTRNVVVCVNLIDEARKKKIHIDLDELSLQLGVPTVATNARKGQGLESLMNEVDKMCRGNTKTFNIKTDYGDLIESSVDKIQKYINNNDKVSNLMDPRWLSLRMLDEDDKLIRKANEYLNINDVNSHRLETVISEERERIFQNVADKNYISDKIVSEIIHKSDRIYKQCVKLQNKQYNKTDRLIDKILTSKITGVPIMILMLMGIFWLTITGANYPSELIAAGLFSFQDKLTQFFACAPLSNWIGNMLVMGVYRTLAWVVSVMLPPMAIFFPLFTLLEDVGYLPRIAFNLDNFFKKAGAHGKQALTMCMGFGCNACGVIGCRIIQSPRERLIAILTNNFVPCNGRFPTLIAIITMFFAGYISSPFRSFISSLILTLVILLGVALTFLVSSFLSKTFLKGIPSSFILELPPYRAPQVGKVLIRSVLDRTVFVLARAAAVAAPAGMVIWIMANVYINNTSILTHCSAFLDPFARLIGLDGVILLAFILGFPANEIVIPIIIMSYMNTGSILELESLTELHSLLVANGWTPITAICTMLFSLIHFPCGTTCWTIRKETGSFKWTALSILIPTVIGIFICFIVCQIGKLILSI